MEWILTEVTADSQKDSHLVHVLDLDSGETLCKRVKPENLTGYVPPSVTAPTCAICLKRMPVKNPLRGTRTRALYLTRQIRALKAQRRALNKRG